MTGFKWVTVAFAALTGCGAPDATDFEAALEASYTQDAPEFAKATGITIEGIADPGAIRGTASSARLAVDAVDKYAGGIAGSMARDVIDGATGLASDFGVQGADGLKAGIDSAMASDWDVANLEILASRKSGDSHVAQVRYDLFSTVGGTRKRMANQVTHSVSIQKSEDGDLVAIPIN